MLFRSPLLMYFRIYKYDDKREPQLQQQFEMQSKYGIMTLALPKNQPSLEVGARYLWQVAILCDSDQPANDLLAMAEMDVVKMPAQVRFVSDDRANIDILAASGLWYDALGEALRTGQKEAVSELMNNLDTLETPKTAQP